MVKIFSTAGRLAKREEELRREEETLSDMAFYRSAISGIDRAVFLAEKHAGKFSTEVPAFDAGDYAEFRGTLATAGIKHLLAYDLPEKDPRSHEAIVQPTNAEVAAAASAGLPAPVAKKPTEEDVARFLASLRQIPNILREKKYGALADMRVQERERRRVAKARRSVHRLAVAYSMGAIPL